MKRAIRFATFGFAVGLLLVGGSCNSALCERWNYEHEAPTCLLDRYQLEIKFATSRTDLRDPSSFLIPIIGRATDSQTSYVLAELPRVQLDFDDTSVVSMQASLDNENRRGVLISRSPESLRLGPLRVKVQLSELPPAETDGKHRVFRSPKLLPSPSVTSMVLGSEKGTIAKFLSAAKVVWASDMRDDAAMHVVVTEDATDLGLVNRRWLGRYLQATPVGTSGLSYAKTAAWTPVQAVQNEGKYALLGLIPKTVIIYDDAKTPGMFQLSMLQYGAASTDTLSPMSGAVVPKTATAMATSSEEPVVMLAEGKQVSLFRVDQVGIFGSVTQLSPELSPQLLTSGGAPVIAARDPRATSFKTPGDDYFGVVWDSGSGRLQLIKLVKSAGIPTKLEISPAPDVVVAKGLTAAALADLDSDGLHDLIVARADGTLAWSPQLPDGSFGALTTLGVSVPEGITSISVGDISGDKLPDVVVGCKDGKLRVFYNQ